MKFASLLFSAAMVLSLTSCVQTTLENRRDLYFPEPVNGPYTRMLNHGVPKVHSVTTTTTTETTTTSRDYKDVVR